MLQCKWHYAMAEVPVWLCLWLRKRSWLEVSGCSYRERPQTSLWLAEPVFVAPSLQVLLPRLVLLGLMTAIRMTLTLLKRDCSRDSSRRVLVIFNNYIHKKFFWRILTMVYNIQNYWVSSVGILETREHNVSETGSVSFLRWGGKTPTLLSPLGRANSITGRFWNVVFSSF
jgi:hypothetical protein